MMHALRYLLASTFFMLVWAACGGEVAAPEKEAAEAEYVSMQAAPHLPDPIAETYRAHASLIPVGKDLSYQMELNFYGTQRFKGRITHDATTSRINMTRDSDGASLRFNGEQVALLPATATWKRARFAAFTWPYFAAAPFKLADAGTRWSPMQDYGWATDIPQQGAKLTFEAGTGDAPDDYYIAFANSDGLLDGLAYIVTYGKDKDAQAEAEPHAIVYSDYRKIDNVPIAHAWKFHLWDAENGLGEEIGDANVSEVQWIARDEKTYAVAGGKIIEAPE